MQREVDHGTFSAVNLKLILWFTSLVVVVVFSLFKRPFVIPSFEVFLYPLMFSVGLVYITYGIWSRPNGNFQKYIFAFSFFVEQSLGFWVYWKTDLNEVVLIYWNVVIALAGRQYGRPGAMITALGTSVLFSVAHTLKSTDEFQSFYFSLLLNNLTFIGVALISGSLSRNYERLQVELEMKNAALSDLQNLQQFLIDQLNEGLISVEPDRSVVEVNPAALKILGLKEFNGGHLETLNPLLNEQLSGFQKSGSKTARFDLVIEVEEEEKKLSVVYSQLIQLSTLKGYLISMQDVTREKLLEESIRQSEKMAAVGQIAAGIAHEIRNPLASISGSIQMLDSMLTDRPDEKQLMRISLREIDRLNNMITEFMEFVRPDKVQLNRLDLTNLVRETLEMVKVNTKLRQDVSVEFENPGSIEIEGDVNKLKQVLLNIFINSYQAMENREVARLKVTLRKEHSFCHLNVQDSGCGMDEKTRKRMFEPFLTTKPKGTGLGLAVTHKILEMHRAQVFVKSELNVGTEFEIVFPTPQMVTQ